MRIGEKIHFLLNIKGLKQKDLAVFLNTKPSTINGWKEDNRNPTTEFIVPICEFFDIDISDFFLKEPHELIYANNNLKQSNSFNNYIQPLFEKLNNKNRDKIEGMIELKLHEQLEEEKNKEKEEKEKQNLNEQLKEAKEIYNINETTEDESYNIDAEDPNFYEFDYIHTRLFGDYFYEDNKLIPFDSETCNKEDFHFIPVLGWTAAGSPIEATEYGVYDMRIVAKNNFSDYALEVRGKSMEPIIKAGSFIEVTQTNYIDNGQIAIANIDGEITCKKFYFDRKEDETIVTMVSINPLEKDRIFIINEHTQDSFNIIGKVNL